MKCGIQFIFSPINFLPCSTWYRYFEISRHLKQGATRQGSSGPGKKIKWLSDQPLPFKILFSDSYSELCHVTIKKTVIKAKLSLLLHKFYNISFSFVT